MNHSDHLNLPDLQERVRAALRQWHTVSAEPSPLASLQLFQQLYNQGTGDSHEVTNRVILQALQILEEQHKKDAILLRRSFLDNELDERIANDLNIASSTLYRHKNIAEHHLAAVLLELEQNVRATHRQRMLQRLCPPSYTQLFGVEEHLERLETVLVAPDPPWIVALAGMGGIGKTSLADAVTRHLIERGDVQNAGWVTARLASFQWDGMIHENGSLGSANAPTFEVLVQELAGQVLSDMPAARHASHSELLEKLRMRLKESPHLIVVDNLETIADIETVVTALRSLAGPTKFLLTSRESLFTQPDIYHYAVPELSAESALSLIRQEAQQRNLSALLDAADEDLLTIFDVVGGNPLALRLVVGQMYVYALDDVLENLRAARGEHIERLYTYIYRQIWDQLDDVTRLSLLAMPLVPPNGAELSLLAQITEIEYGKLARSLETLVRLNLVDVRGDFRRRRYSIHNLTRTFLHEQVIRWQST